MKELSALNVFFWKYRARFFIGIVFVIATNYLAVLAPQITGYVVGLVQAKLPGAKPVTTVHNEMVTMGIDQIGNYYNLTNLYFFEMSELKNLPCDSVILKRV